MRLALAVMLLAAPAGSLPAQAASFVARLGNDTMQVERFSVRGTHLEGTVVTAVPSTRIIRWQADLDARGGFARYEASTTGADGLPIADVPAQVVMTWLGDSLIRELVTKGERSEQRLAVPSGTVPGPSLPYLGTSFLLWEWGFRQANASVPDSTGARVIPQLTSIARQLRPSRTRFWQVGTDSAEADYFGVARSGWIFDAAGNLLRADWRGTTYRYRIERTAPIDVEALARTWHARDQAGQGIGAMSPRDTVAETIGTLGITIDYSRPARRGRTIWGDVVPFDRVWRLGADMATQITLSADAMVGGTLVPAGRYSLWMLPQQAGSSMLVINKQAQIFGTQYNAKEDLVRIPLTRAPLATHVERLTLVIDSARLVIRWGDLEWAVPIAPK